MAPFLSPWVSPGARVVCRIVHDMVSFQTTNSGGRPGTRFSWGIVGLALIVSGYSVLGCGDDRSLGRIRPQACDFVDPPTDKVRVELLTFWSEDEQESRALSVLQDRAEKVPLHYSETSDADRSTLQRNLQVGNSAVLPDVFQVNGGSDVLQYVPSSSPSSICQLDRLIDEYDVKERYFGAALQASQCKSSYFAWPLSIHRLNTLMVNMDAYKRVLAYAHERRLRVTPLEDMKTADELLDFLERVKSWEVPSALGHPLDALALGIQYRDPDLPDQVSGQEWVLQVVAFENLLVSYQDHAYERIWHGSGDWQDDELEELVDRLTAHLARLGLLVEGGPRSWQAAAQAVGEGLALLTIGGDWMRAQVDEAKLDHVINLPFPGTKGAYVYTPDSFAVPEQFDSDGSAVHRWFSEVVDDAATQINFGRIKQAIPARADLSESDLEGLSSDYLSESYRQFSQCHQADSSCRLLLAVSGLGPASNVDPCFDRLAQVIALLTGMDSVNRGPMVGVPACPREMPKSISEAKVELKHLLMAYSKNPYRSECRHVGNRN